MLTRRGWSAGVLAGVLLVAGRVFGTIEGYIAGASLAVLLVGSVLWLVAHPHRHLRGPGAATRPGARRLLHPGRPHRHQPGPALEPGPRPARPGVGHQRRHAARPPPRPRRRGAGRLPVPHRAPGHRHRRSAPGRADRPVRPGPSPPARPPGRRSWSSTPQIEPLPALPLSSGNDPLAGAEHPNALGRGGEDFSVAARLRGRRRPAAGALAGHRPPRRADGAPGRAAVAGPHDRRARRPSPAVHTAAELRAGGVGRGQHRARRHRAARTSCAW